MNITIRNVELGDLEDYYKWNTEDRKHHDFNGPYFKRESNKELRKS